MSWNPAMVRTPSGAILWRTHHAAMTYANVRATFYRTRQEVRPVPYQGRTMWAAGRAVAKVAEPCS